jgi:hypothetical protein
VNVSRRAKHIMTRQYQPGLAHVGPVGSDDVVWRASGFVEMSLRGGGRLCPRDQAGMIAGTGVGFWSAARALLRPLWGRWFAQNVRSDVSFAER